MLFLNQANPHRAICIMRDRLTSNKFEKSGNNLPIEISAFLNSFIEESLMLLSDTNHAPQCITVNILIFRENGIKENFFRDLK